MSNLEKLYEIKKFKVSIIQFEPIAPTHMATDYPPEFPQKNKIKITVIMVVYCQSISSN